VKRRAPETGGATCRERGRVVGHGHQGGAPFSSSNAASTSLAIGTILEAIPSALSDLAHYPIIDATSWQAASAETLGSKEKEWVLAPDSELWLWKSSRSDAGDDWAEKVAEQLADLLRVPHAEVSLATRNGARGVLVRDFRTHEGRPIGAFTPGNELLWKANQSYPKADRRLITEYTVQASIAALLRVGTGTPITGVNWSEELGPASAFLAYLLLDAWIGNQDRHHENWGVITTNPAERKLGIPLAPSFDHASSLGQNLTDETREKRLTTKDHKGDIAAWARKARTPFCADSESWRAATTFEALGDAIHRHPEAGGLWRGRLQAIEPAQVESAIASIPPSYLSSVGREFTLKLLGLNVWEIMSLPCP
jgi:hypothetical protein